MVDPEVNRRDIITRRSVRALPIDDQGFATAKPILGSEEVTTVLESCSERRRVWA